MIRPAEFKEFIGENLSKSFGPVRAVSSVDFRVGVGEVLGLIGENGAGKSTLLSIISGTLKPDGGVLRRGSETLEFNSYFEATQNGVFRIFQHQALVPNLSVAENMFLAQEARFTSFGVLRVSKMRRLASALFDELGLSLLDPNAQLSQYSFAERQIVEVVRTLAQARLLEISSPLILHDEPTTALSREQVDFFVSFVNRIRPLSAQIFVSHRLQEVVALSDSLLILRDGERVHSVLGDVDSLEESEIHSHMVGRELDLLGAAGKKEKVQEQSALELRNLSGPGFETSNISVRKGEIVGVAGVLGSGKSELLRAVFAPGPLTRGEVLIEGEKVSIRSPRDAIRLGVGYVPPERQLEGIIASMNVRENISLPRVGRAQGSVVIRKGGERELTTKVANLLGVKAPTVEAPVTALSGGNQQKVVLARWVSLEARIMLLDNPTSGVDVGAKSEIYNLIRRLLDSGVGILLASDDLLELISLANRILVYKDGVLTTEIPVDEASPPSELEIVSQMV